jgi:hypothetical protein
MVVIEDLFKAWLDTQPVGPRKLIVTGEVEVPTGGWSVELVAASPQGINPTIKILDLKSSAPSGNVIQVVTKIPVRFEEKPAAHAYTQVTIRNGQNEFSIAVGVVH